MKWKYLTIYVNICNGLLLLGRQPLLAAVLLGQPQVLTPQSLIRMKQRQSEKER